jgi:hypothetical protein
MAIVLGAAGQIDRDRLDAGVMTPKLALETFRQQSVAQVRAVFYVEDSDLHARLRLRSPLRPPGADRWMLIACLSQRVRR